MLTCAITMASCTEGADPSDYLLSQVCNRAARVFQQALLAGNDSSKCGSSCVAGEGDAGKCHGSGGGGNDGGVLSSSPWVGHIANGPASASFDGGTSGKYKRHSSASIFSADGYDPEDDSAAAAAAAAAAVRGGGGGGGGAGADVDEAQNRSAIKSLQTLLQTPGNVAKLPATLVDATEGGVDVSDASLVAASVLGATLRTLMLDGCSWITDVGLHTVASACAELRVLSLQLCHNVTDYGLAKVAEGCPELRKLSLSHNFDVTDHGVRSIAKGCPKVTALSLKNLPRISPSGLTVGVAIRRRPTFDTDAALAAQLQAQMDGMSQAVLEDMRRERQRSESSTVVVDVFAFKALERLDVISCDGVDDELAEVLLRGPSRELGASPSCAVYNNGQSSRCPVDKLTRLSVEGCCSITDQFFALLAPHSTALAQLSVAKCYLLTDQTIAALTLAAPAQLEQIDLSFCPAISGKGILELAKACPALRQVCVVDCSGVSRVDQRALETIRIHCHRSTFGALQPL